MSYMPRTDIMRWELINLILSKKDGETAYLEIGIDQGTNLKEVKDDIKDSVDPNHDPKYRMTSDAFFYVGGDQMYDVIFIDGMHTGEQVAKDIQNSLKRLKPNGRILCHDCSPWEPKRLDPMWSGTCWEAVAALVNDEYGSLVVCTVDIDTGIAVIRKRSIAVVPVRPCELAETTYEFLNEHRKELLNLISYEEYIDNYL